ncbi:MAG: M28 family peptidase [Promethearchaeota archaeon]|nr:MAG: M28 family peptidase [Candidatus Lokiarchaeota archaeon]
MKIILIPLFSIILLLSLLLLFDDYYYIYPIIYSFYTYLLLISSIIGMIFAPLYIFMFKKNIKESKGAIDNASGVSILIELAKYYKHNPLKNYDILLLFCGGEEYGLKGSDYFCKKYMSYFAKQYDLKKSVNINIDMVGSHIGLLNKSPFSIFYRNKKLIHLINYSADLLDIPIDNYSKILNPKSDNLSFKKHSRKVGERKFQNVCFNSVKDTKFIHTIMDTPEMCSIQNLFNCFRICLLTSQLLDSEIND